MVGHVFNFVLESYAISKELLIVRFLLYLIGTALSFFMFPAHSCLSLAYLRNGVCARSPGTSTVCAPQVKLRAPALQRLFDLGNQTDLEAS